MAPRREGVTTAVEVRLDVERFVSTEYSRVVAAVRLITGRYDGAPEAVQDSILELVSTPPREAPSDYAAWVTVTASKMVQGTRHGRGAQRPALTDARTPQQGAGGGPDTLDVDVHAALEALPQQQRQVAVLYYLLDQSVDSIAASLGVAAATVEAHLRHARSALAARLGRDADHD